MKGIAAVRSISIRSRFVYFVQPRKDIKASILDVVEDKDHGSP